VTAEAAKEQIRNADVLVNPRRNDAEYTKYSFPSKNVEYLLSGNPVVGYMLDGMGQAYRDFMYIVADDRPESLRDAIEAASRERGTSAALDYLAETCEASKIGARILSMNGMR
jgi:hypothetical protein